MIKNKQLDSEFLEGYQLWQKAPQEGWRIQWLKCCEHHIQDEYSSSQYVENNNNIINKKDKYLNLARELKKLWNMKVTIVPIVTGVLGTITKKLLKGLEDLEIGGRVETIQTTALLRTARILRRVQET